LVFLGLWLALPTVATEASVLQRFETRYRSASALRARFLERYLENGKLVRVEAGEAYFLKPGKMRWDYESPEKNTFLVDGKYVWFYSSSDHTATRMPVKQSDDWRTPLAFLTGHMKLASICSRLQVDSGTPAGAGNSVYSCALRAAGEEHGGAPKVAHFEISSDGELVRVLVPQEGSVVLEFSFTGWKFDPVLPKELFRFLPSRDTVIVDGLLPEAPGMRQ